jgi:arylsulfatase A-like enzyme
MRMNRREFVKLAGAGACLAGLSSLSAGAGSKDRPNIVLCMADDQGWGDMGYYGHPVLKTPNFDDMAVTGLRFDRFYAAAPVCSPTRGSVLTGRHPNRFGCFKWGFPIRPQEITIAEVLKKAGYATGHFGKWHLGSVCKGSPVNPGAKGFDEWFSAPNFFDNDPIMSREGVAVPTPGESSMITVDAALAFIRKQAAASQPFLAVVWFGNPHAPHEALAEDLALYQDQNKKLQNYYGEVTAMDRAFGKLRQELGTLGIRDHTILWYCSDNGGLPGVGVTGGRGNKGQIYEGGLRVPGLLEWPARVTRPRITNVPANTCDIFPTLLEIVGIRPEPRRPLDGVSLLPLFGGRMETRPKPMGFWDHPTPGRAMASKQWMASLYAAQKAGQEVDDPAHQALDAGQITTQYPEDSFPGHAAWLDWPWKLHRIETKGRVRTELYNLADDPQESQDLAARSPDRTKSLRAPLEAWLLSVVRSLNGKDYV